MSDPVGNPKDQFSRVVAHCGVGHSRQILPMSKLGAIILFYRAWFTEMESDAGRTKRLSSAAKPGPKVTKQFSFFFFFFFFKIANDFLCLLEV